MTAKCLALPAFYATPPVPLQQATDRAREKARVWVDPHRMPDYGDISGIGGNAPDHVKRLMRNTFFAVAVGDPSCFAQSIGKDIKFVEVNLDANPLRKGSSEVTTVAEVYVTRQTLNGAGTMHGGCTAYLIDSCSSTPLIALGVAKDVNGVGMTQSLTITYHSPAPLGTSLQIISTSITLGRRVMSARCEVIAKESGRVIASASLSKMQPKL